MNRFEGLIDVARGKIPMNRIGNEIRFQKVTKKNLKHLILDVWLRQDDSVYLVVYMSRKDFFKKEGT